MGMTKGDWLVLISFFRQPAKAIKKNHNHPLFSRIIVKTKNLAGLKSHKVYNFNSCQFTLPTIVPTKEHVGENTNMGRDGQEHLKGI